MSPHEPAGAAGSSSIGLVVGVATYRRPQELTELLPLLAGQAEEVRRALPEVASVRIVVVDNDPEGSALSVPCPADVRIVHERTPGVSAARNQLLREAADADALLFIDDDERPRNGWLELMVRTWLRHGAQAVAGRVVAEFPDRLDPWLEAGGFYVRRSMTTGSVVSFAPAGNLLLDVPFVRAHGLAFHPALSLSGGEDTLFTRELTARGGRIVWCDEAAVVDRVPAERMTRRWVLNRALSHGNTTALLDVYLGRGPVPTRRARAAAEGLARVGGGLAVASAGVVMRRPRHQARGLRMAGRGLGRTLGAGGWSIQEYARAGQPRLERARLRPAPDQTPSPATPSAHRPAPSRPRTPALGKPIVWGAALGGSVVAVHTTRPVVVLTFDDGPDPDVTPALLRVLADYGASATFFVLMSQVREHPETLDAILAGGHEVALHGMDHRRLTSVPTRAAVESVMAARDELEARTGRRVRWFRPPYGAQTPALWARLRRSGLDSVLWSATTWDWRDVCQDERVAMVLANVSPGTILLAHDGRATPSDRAAHDPVDSVDKPDLLRRILAGIGEAGLSGTSLSDALSSGRPVRRASFSR